MSMFIVQSRTAGDRINLDFETEGVRLIAMASSEGTPEVSVQAFDERRDVFYVVPELPTAIELEEELRIHFPQSLTSNLDGRAVASTIGHSVLLQVVDEQTPSLSPLAALRRVLEAIGTVNSAMLQADNGGLLFIRRAGDEFTAHSSTHSISTFLNLTYEEREQIFQNFSAQEVILSGSDLQGIEVDLSDPLLLMRKIGVQDFVAIVDIAEDVFELVNAAPYRYTFAIGAASIYAEIRRYSMDV